MRKTNLGLIGLGYIGKVHLRNCIKSKNANLLAVCDVSKRALLEAKKQGIKETFSNYEEMLKNKEIDAVIVALPTHLHLECVKNVMQSGKHVLVEKPLAINVNDAKEIVFLAQKNSVKLMVGYPLRFNSIMLGLKNQLLSGELGDVTTAYATNISCGPFMHRAIGDAPVPVPEWWFNKKMTGGGALMDLGSHMINILRFYFGEIISIESQLGYRYNFDVEDHVICLAQFSSGTKAIINAGWTSQGYQVKIDMHGSVKNAVADNVPPNRLLAATQMLLFNRSPFWQPYISELEYFVNCISNDRQPFPSGIDGLRDLEAIESAYKNSTKLNK